MVLGKKKLKILIVTTASYPAGYALTKRLHLYAKGLIKNGANVQIVITRPTEKKREIKNQTRKSVFEKVRFIYASPSTIRSNFVILRKFNDLIGIFNTFLIIIRERPQAIIVTAFSKEMYRLLYFFSKIFKFKIIREKNEVDYYNNNSITSSELSKLKKQYRLYDGVIAINYKIEDYIKSIVKSDVKIVVVPVLVENFFIRTSKENKITYTGTYLERKDGIITILKGFAKALEKHPELKLVLTGSPEKSSDFPEINEVIAKLNLKRSIYFTGYLLEDDLKKLLLTSSALIICKPENRQNEYNFPTKIGEYLSTGRPVLSTRVGIVGEKLEDGKNIVFIKNKPDDIAEKIDLILRNHELSKEIGLNGREYALRNFNVDYHTNQVLTFIEELYL